MARLVMPSWVTDPNWEEKWDAKVKASKEEFERRRASEEASRKHSEERDAKIAAARKAAERERMEQFRYDRYAIRKRKEEKADVITAKLYERQLVRYANA